MFIDKINKKTKAATWIRVCVCVYVSVYFPTNKPTNNLLTLLLCLFGSFPKNKQIKKLFRTVFESKLVLTTGGGTN